MKTGQGQDAFSSQQMQEYRARGFLLQASVFSGSELDLLRREADTEFREDSPRRTVEKLSGVVRAVHGSHLYRPLLAQLVRLPRLLLPARQLLADDVYVYQFKINAKRAFKGDVWEWHQDYIFWHHEDGMRSPRALTAAVFLDDVTEFNGPLVLVPGGHSHGMFDMMSKSDGMESALAADLKYSLSPNIMRGLVAEHGLVAPKAGKGSVLWFDCNIPHGSAPNMSPFDRALLLVTYNAVSNAPPAVSTRPEWLVSRDSSPLRPADTDGRTESTITAEPTGSLDPGGR